MAYSDKRMKEICGRLRKLSWTGKEVKIGLNEVKEQI